MERPGESIGACSLANLGPLMFMSSILSRSERQFSFWIACLIPPSSFWTIFACECVYITSVLASIHSVSVPFYRHAGQLIMMSVYGIQVGSRDDRFIQVAQNVMDAVSEAAKPGAWLVDMFPIRELFINFEKLNSC